MIIARFRLHRILACVALAGCSGAQLPFGATPATHVAPNLTARTERILFTFTGGNDGGDPAADLIFDASGNLYGTTVTGGTDSCGTVFKLAHQSNPPWQESVLNNFTCHTGGQYPYGGVTFGPYSNLYGTTLTSQGTAPCAGPSCGGVAYDLLGSSEVVLHSFKGGADGFGPGDALAKDQQGNLYGTTLFGGTKSYGVVYQLYIHLGKWFERALHTFSGRKGGGGGMMGRLTIDAAGNIYGVSEAGGVKGAGTVYRLTPTSKARNSFTFTTLYEFKGAPDCAAPYGGLYEATNGDLYGTTSLGGSSGLGCVFVLNKSSNYTDQIVHSFTGGSDGSEPTSTLVAIRDELYGTTPMGGGSCDCGTVFSVNKRTGQETVNHVFNGGSDGAYPYYGLATDSAGNLYGTTTAGGASNQGTIFELAKP